MKITILGDSVSLPRPKGSGNIPYEATYPYLLDRALREEWGAEAPMVIERGRRMRTIQDVVDDWEDEVILKQVDVAIVQVGGNDCTPRVFLPLEIKMLERLPIFQLREKLLRMEKRHRRSLLLALPQRTFVSLKKFRNHIDTVVKFATEAKVALIFVKIMPLTPKISHHLPGVARNVDVYNRVIDEVAAGSNAQVVDVATLVEKTGGLEGFSLDGMHYTAKGHAALAEELKVRIDAFMKQQKRRVA